MAKGKSVRTWIGEGADTIVVRAHRIVRLSLGVVVHDSVVLLAPAAQKWLPHRLIEDFNDQVSTRSPVSFNNRVRKFVKYLNNENEEIEIDLLGGTRTVITSGNGIKRSSSNWSDDFPANGTLMGKRCGSADWTEREIVSLTLPPSCPSVTLSSSTSRPSWVNWSWPTGKSSSRDKRSLIEPALATSVHAWVTITSSEQCSFTVTTLRCCEVDEEEERYPPPPPIEAELLGMMTTSRCCCWLLTGLCSTWTYMVKVSCSSSSVISGNSSVGSIAVYQIAPFTWKRRKLQQQQLEEKKKLTEIFSNSDNWTYIDLINWSAWLRPTASTTSTLTTGVCMVTKTRWSYVIASFSQCTHTHTHTLGNI